MEQAKDGAKQPVEFHPYSKIDKVLVFAFDRIEEVYKTKNPLTGLPSGFHVLDDMTTGFQPADFVIIGSRPSVGKTILALNMTAHIAFRERRPVAFFSMEMPGIVFAQCLISGESLVEARKMRNGLLIQDDFRRIVDVIGTMLDAPLFLVDESNMKLHDLCLRIRELRAREDVEIVFIDCLERIGFENSLLPRHEQISEISSSLKNLAWELQIPIVLLCELKREISRSEPIFASLGEFVSIERDADLVMFLNRKPQDAEEGSPVDSIPTELIIAKQRNGPMGRIDLVLRSEYMRFVPLA